jgi:hypothetical protein
LNLIGKVENPLRTLPFSLPSEIIIITEFAPLIISRNHQFIYTGNLLQKSIRVMRYESASHERIRFINTCMIHRIKHINLFLALASAAAAAQNGQQNHHSSLHLCHLQLPLLISILLFFINRSYRFIAIDKFSLCYLLVTCQDVSLASEFPL